MLRTEVACPLTFRYSAYLTRSSVEAILRVFLVYALRSAVLPGRGGWLEIYFIQALAAINWQVVHLSPECLGPIEACSASSI